MKLYLGIDGGGTRTRAFVTDDSCRVAAWGEAGLSNPNHATSAEWRGNLGKAIQDAFTQIHHEISDCVSAFAGIAGVTTETGRGLIRAALADCGLGGATLAVDHDIRIALAGGLALKPGIALIVGTGSSCYGRTVEGANWQTGGWEALISDEGSAFFLAREAIAAAARMADGRAAETPLRKRVFDWLGISHVAQVLPRLQDQGLTRSQIASFAPQVVRLAEESDSAASEILERGAFLLAEMVAANHRMLPTGSGPDVVITGGLGTADTLYRSRIVASILAQRPTASVHRPALAPAVGAALLAMTQSGQSISDHVIERLKAVTVP